MTLSNRRWFLCAVLLSVAARFGTCRRHREDAVLPELFIFNELCALRDEPGPCKAIKERFFFNVDTGLCEQFEYGGCGGNANNFMTLEQCEETCVVSDDKNPCHLQEAPGPCRGLVTRYFFDSSSQRCRHFFYGGCFGNANNFNSMSECQAKCHSPAEPPREPEHHTLSAAKSAAVWPTVLTGDRRGPLLQSNVTDQESEALIPAELCVHPVDRGTCHGAEKRFAFNPETKRCQMFHYSGCGGNENNFTKRKTCFQKCIGGRKPFGARVIRIRKKNLDYLSNRST